MPAELEETWKEGGWYDARIEVARCDESGGGTPGILLSWIVTDGEMAGKYVQDDHWISRNNASTQRDTFLKTLNYDIAKENNDSTVGKLEGMEASIKVQMNEFPKGSGRWNPRVGRMRKKGMTGLMPGQRIAQFFGISRDEEIQEGEAFDAAKFDKLK